MLYQCWHKKTAQSLLGRAGGAGKAAPAHRMVTRGKEVDLEERKDRMTAREQGRQSTQLQKAGQAHAGGASAPGSGGPALYAGMTEGWGQRGDRPSEQ